MAWDLERRKRSFQVASSDASMLRIVRKSAEIDHTTIINWVEEAGESLPDEPQDSEIPEITEIDELQAFVGSKRNKLWIWTVVNHQKKGIILWNIGDCSHQSFEPNMGHSPFGASALSRLGAGRMPRSSR